MRKALWSGVSLPPGTYEPLREMTPVLPCYFNFLFFSVLLVIPLTWSLEVDTDYGVVMGCLLPSELPWDPVVVAPVEQLLTQLFFLGDRDEQSSSPANRGKHTPSFYPAENLDNGVIDQRVLKQRWGC